MASRLITTASMLAWLASLAFAPAAAITLEEFGRSAAAAAYAAGRHELALDELAALLRREPRDPILLRVRGMALHRLGRFEDAEAALTAAVIAAPGDPAAHYWLGATRHARGNRAGALAEFAMAERLAPETPYGVGARAFIAAIGGAAPSLAAAPERPWALAVAGGAQFDDNVSLVRRGRIASLRGFGEATGSHAFALPHGFVLAFDGRAYGSAHARAAADDFDLLLLAAGSTVSRRIAIGDVPARLSLAYSYEHVAQGGRFYSGAHAIAPQLELALLPDSVTAARLVLGFDRFALDPGSDPGLFSRDGRRYTAAIRHVHFIAERRHFVWGGYEFTRYDTEGRTFEAHAHVASLGAGIALPWALRLELAAELGRTRYVNGVDMPKRRSLKQIYSAWLTKQLGPNLSLALAYAYTFDDSTIDDLETRRNVVTLSARYSF